MELANLLQVNVSLVWVDSQANMEAGITPEAVEKREEGKNNLEELVNEYKGKLLHGKINCRVRKGKVYYELAAQAKLNRSDLIIAGTHGVSGFEEYWIGSNTYRIVSYAPCPVIAVRYSYDLARGIRHIVMPFDSTPHSIQKLPFTAALAKAVGADINILAINSSPLKTLQRLVHDTVVKAEKYLEHAGVNFMLDTVEESSIAATVIEYARKVDADLVSIVSPGQDSSSNVILGQSVQQLVNHCPVPVLSIQHMENFTLV